MRFGGGVKKCDLLNSLGGRGEFVASPPSLTLLCSFQLKLVFKVVMPVERRNTASLFQAKMGRNGEETERLSRWK